MPNVRGASRVPKGNLQRQRRNWNRLAIQGSDAYGDGLTLDSTGRVIVDLATVSGLEFIASQLRIDTDNTQGTRFQGNALAIGEFDSIANQSSSSELAVIDQIFLAGWDTTDVRLEKIPAHLIPPIAFLTAIDTDDSDELIFHDVSFPGNFNRKVRVDELFLDNKIILDLDKDTHISALVDDEILLHIRGEDSIKMTLNQMQMESGDNYVIRTKDGGDPAGPSLTIQAGDGDLDKTGGTLTLKGGDAPAGFFGTGGPVVLEGGSTGVVGTPADIILKPGTGTGSPAEVARFKATTIEFIKQLDMQANAILGVAGVSMNQNTRIFFDTDSDTAIWAPSDDVMNLAAGTGAVALVLTPSLVTISKDAAFTSTGRMLLPKGTVAQRPGSPVAGWARYNSDDDQFEYYNGTAWVQPSTMLGFSGANANVLIGTTVYLGEGNGLKSATQANQEYRIPRDGTLQNFYVFVSANASDTNGNTVTVMLNGAATAITVSYNTLETGEKSDLSNIVTVVQGDKIAFRVVNTGAGVPPQDVVVENISLEVA